MCYQLRGFVTESSKLQKHHLVLPKCQANLSALHKHIYSYVNPMKQRVKELGTGSLAQESMTRTLVWLPLWNLSSSHFLREKKQAGRLITGRADLGLSFSEHVRQPTGMQGLAWRLGHPFTVFRRL